MTLVEFFDFNCGFCKKGLADVQKVLDTDKNVRVILKEFPILAPGSRDASVVALALRYAFAQDRLGRDAFDEREGCARVAQGCYVGVYGKR